MQTSTSLARRVLAGNPGAIFGAMILVAVVLMAATAELFFPDSPFDMAGKPYLWPFQDIAHPLGTDNQGRDIAAGLFYGARVSLMVGFTAAFICLFIGAVIGAASGYFGGPIEKILVVLTETIQSMPSFLFLVVLVVIFDPSTTTMMIGIGVVSWPMVARLVRAEFRSLRSREFVTAARGFGFSNSYIIFREILPNALPPLIVTSSVIVASAILWESALAFLGLGDPNKMSWGMMIGNGRIVIRTAWYLSAIPGTFILLTVLSINVLGEALNDALNPRLAEM